MANRVYGLNRGQTEFQVTEGAATSGKSVEVVVDLSQGLLKEDVLLALEQIENHIVTGNWPPA